MIYDARSFSRADQITPDNLNRRERRKLITMYEDLTEIKKTRYNSQVARIYREFRSPASTFPGANARRKYTKA